MVSDALQIPYKKEDYVLYKKWTKDRRQRQLAFMLALFKFRSSNHLQCAFSGEFGQGKTSGAWVMAKWEGTYQRRLWKHYKREGWEKLDISFSVEDNMIISPKDPASKYLKTPKRLMPYEIDEGYLFATSSEAGTANTKRIRNNITQNRKLQPSNYWVYPNLFKMPSMILELMDIVIHKEDIRTGDVLIPSRVIQLKEKFDKERLQRYAKYPKYFKNLIRFHPAFIAKVKFPRVRGPRWEAYLAKYEKYKVVEEDAEEKQAPRIKLYEKVEGLIEKGVITITSQEGITKLMYEILKKGSKNEQAARRMATSLANGFSTWHEDKIATSLSSSLSESLVRSVMPKVDIEEEDENA